MSSITDVLAVKRVELHRHLDGSMRMATVKELALSHNRTVPDNLLFHDNMGLDDALARFAFTLSLLQDPESVARVAAEMCEDAAAEGISSLEIRFAPQLHNGATMDRILDAAIEGAGGRAGFILCALYGESPEILRALVELGASRHHVVGIDLAGGPAPQHKWTLPDYAEPFELARKRDLGRTVHAGEGRCVQEIRQAIEILGAQRIGHGTTLLDDPAVVEIVHRNQITIESCPSSNVHTGAVDSLEQHPLPLWVAEGIPVAVCADNTLLSNTDVTQELERVCRMPNMDLQKLQHAVLQSSGALFSDHRL
jgi:adenosine deaminase